MRRQSWSAISDGGPKCAGIGSPGPCAARPAGPPSRGDLCGEQFRQADEVAGRSREGEGHVDAFATPHPDPA